VREDRETGIITARPDMEDIEIFDSILMSKIVFGAISVPVMRKDQIIRIFKDVITLEYKSFLHDTEPLFHEDRFNILVENLNPYLEEIGNDPGKNTWPQVQNCLVIIDQSLQLWSKCEYGNETLTNYLEHIIDITRITIFDSCEYSEGEFNYEALFEWLTRLSEKKEYSSALDKYGGNSKYTLEQKTTYLKESFNEFRRRTMNDRLLFEMIIGIMRKHPNREKLNYWLDDYLEGIGY